MSKSRGNVVNPLEALEKWGVDGVRWYLMRVGGSLADDAGTSSTRISLSLSPYPAYSLLIVASLFHLFISSKVEEQGPAFGSS